MEDVYKRHKPQEIQKKMQCLRIKNTLDEINGILNNAEEKINDLKNTATETMQN